MICNRCGAVIPDGQSFCSQCGNSLADNNGVQYNYQPQNNQQYYPQQPQGEVAPVTTMGQYILWSLVALIPIPILRIVLIIVFACSKENKNRANFFKAMIVVWAVSLVVIVIAVILLVAFNSVVLTELYDEFQYAL